MAIFALTCGGLITMADDHETAPADGAAAAEDKGRESVWMRIKLKSADGILEGLARADFDGITRNAQVMRQFGRLERWARVKDEDYLGYLDSFNRANEGLMRQAKRENLEGATLAFFELTNSCVRCHDVVRDNRQMLPDEGEKVTHSVEKATEYYVGGPQQGRPADGIIEAGTEVSLIETAGSYALVLTEDGVRGYVAIDALVKLSDDDDGTGDDGTGDDGTGE
ncbi:MAG: hypothetical protein DWQ35_04585 [Planctomycetota bacterium]|nr:MAG: hypothetical protein DWQ35_04585 [Planctomycetota bacterium]REK25120.1 MAG: hypothetical protein DWQ42_12175 [Planctomycetota bacterium]